MSQRGPLTLFDKLAIDRIVLIKVDSCPLNYRFVHENEVDLSIDL
jgi:hypothetical protein